MELLGLVLVPVVLGLIVYGVWLSIQLHDADATIERLCREANDGETAAVPAVGVLHAEACVGSDQSQQVS